MSDKHGPMLERNPFRELALATVLMALLLIAAL